jgi:hypothetical protein
MRTTSVCTLQGFQVLPNLNVNEIKLLDLKFQKLQITTKIATY